MATPATFDPTTPAALTAAPTADPISLLYLSKKGSFAVDEVAGEMPSLRVKEEEEEMLELTVGGR